MRILLVVWSLITFCDCSSGSTPAIFPLTPAQQTALTMIHDLLQELHVRHLTSVDPSQVSIWLTSSSSTFLRSEPGRLYVSRNLLAHAPQRVALLAILDHEMKHMEDYAHMSLLELLYLGALELFDGDSLPVIHYERRTDTRVLCLGLATGLSLYREWLYNQLPSTLIAQKRLIYFTPEEISKFAASPQACNKIEESDLYH
jgi:hypothetical protein